VHQFIVLHRGYSPLRLLYMQFIPAPQTLHQGRALHSPTSAGAELPVPAQCRRGGHRSLSNALLTVGALTCRSLPMRL
jgi:hypothetical protein